MQYLHPDHIPAHLDRFPGLRWHMWVACATAYEPDFAVPALFDRMAGSVHAGQALKRAGWTNYGIFWHPPAECYPGVARVAVGVQGDEIPAYTVVLVHVGSAYAKTKVPLEFTAGPEGVGEFLFPNLHPVGWDEDALRRVSTMIAAIYPGQSGKLKRAGRDLAKAIFENYNEPAPYLEAMARRVFEGQFRDAFMKELRRRTS